MVMKVEVDPQEKLAKALRYAGARVGNLTIPLKLIAQQWFKSNRAIFSIQGPGKYVDLTDLYKKRKQKEAGFIYPILKKSGRLAQSITVPNEPESINYIINRKSLVLGSRTPYAIYHQSEAPRTKLPRRPMVLFGNEQVAPDALERRVADWEKMILDFVLDQTGGASA